MYTEIDALQEIEALREKYGPIFEIALQDCDGCIDEAIEIREEDKGRYLREGSHITLNDCYCPDRIFVVIAVLDNEKLKIVSTSAVSSDSWFNISFDRVNKIIK